VYGLRPRAGTSGHAHTARQLLVIAEQMDRDVVGPVHAAGRERYLVWPAAIDAGLAEFALSVDHAITPRCWSPPALTLLAEEGRDLAFAELAGGVRGMWAGVKYTFTRLIDFPSFARIYAPPIRMPAARTSPPPSTTWNAARKNGVSM